MYNADYFQTLDGWIEKYTGVKGYKGRANQIDKMMECITEDNYMLMKDRISRMNMPDNECGSSNAWKMFKYFEDESAEWIEGLNNALE